MQPEHFLSPSGVSLYFIAVRMASFFAAKAATGIMATAMPPSFSRLRRDSFMLAPFRDVQQRVGRSLCNSASDHWIV